MCIRCWRVGASVCAACLILMLLIYYVRCLQTHSVRRATHDMHSTITGDPAPLVGVASHDLSPASDSPMRVAGSVDKQSAAMPMAGEPASLLFPQRSVIGDAEWDSLKEQFMRQGFSNTSAAVESLSMSTSWSDAVRRLSLSPGLAKEFNTGIGGRVSCAWQYPGYFVLLTSGRQPKVVNPPPPEWTHVNAIPSPETLVQVQVLRFKKPHAGR